MGSFHCCRAIPVVIVGRVNSACQALRKGRCPVGVSVKDAVATSDNRLSVAEFVRAHGPAGVDTTSGAEGPAVMTRSPEVSLCAAV
jgi:hypothetical protein